MAGHDVPHTPTIEDYFALGLMAVYPQIPFWVGTNGR